MQYSSYHFIGVGGVGMSAIAQVLLEQGLKVSGSDVMKNARAQHLEDLGAKIHVGHAPHNLNGSEVAIVSSAISINNPEVKAAIRRGVPILHRSEMLAMLMQQKKGIAIAGTHGKTTTTAMVSLMVERAGLDPTILIGAELEQFKSNAKTGKGEWLIAEADESDGSLVRLSPRIAVVTNLEADHMDYYADVSAIRTTFQKFLNRLPEDGLAILCVDDQNVRMLADQVSRRTVTYGLNNGAHIKAVNVEFAELGSSFTVLNRGLEIGRFHLRVPGMHNIYNCLACIAVGLEIGIDINIIRASFNEFKGASRRFQVIGDSEAMTVVDDYAHHPTEIMATLSAARKVRRDGRIISVFQPHRYTRTKYFFDLYGQCFFNSDIVIVTDIYSAGEKPIPSISGEVIARSLARYGHQSVTYIPNIADVATYVQSIAGSNDFVITLGAGDVWKVARELAQPMPPVKELVAALSA